MSRVIINSVLTVLAFLVVVLAVLQTGIGGEKLRLSHYFGATKQAMSTTATYGDCQKAGGIITLAIPRNCVVQNITFYESFQADNEQKYSTEVENQAAGNGVTLAHPTKYANFDTLILATPNSNELAYGANYSTLIDGKSAYAYILNKSTKGVNNDEYTKWQTLLASTNVADLTPIFGGNTATLSPYDASAHNLQNAIILIDGKAEKFGGDLSVLVAGVVRDNYILLKENLSVPNQNTLLAACMTSVESSKENKKIAAQNCLNEVIAKDAKIREQALEIAAKLTETFAF